MGKRIEGEMDYSRMQRIHALLENEKVDRVPLWFMMEGFCPLTAGYSINSYYTDVEKSFWSQVWTYEMYELDEDPKWSHSAGGAIVFGGEIRFPTEEWMQAISVSRHPVKSEEDVYRLRMPDVKTAGLIPFAMEFAKLQNKYGMFIQPHVVDPFSFAGHVCGVDNLMRWVVRRPETVHHLMRIVVNYLGEVMQYWVDTFGPKRILPWMSSSTSSNALISVRHFDQFVFPYFKELTEKILEIGIKHIHHHLCGDHNFNLPLWSKVPRGNPGIISCGPEVDLSEAILKAARKKLPSGAFTPPPISLYWLILQSKVNLN